MKADERSRSKPKPKLLPELVPLLAALTGRNSRSITQSCLIDATPVLQNLREGMSHQQHPLQQFVLVCRSTTKWLRGKKTSTNPKYRISISTAEIIKEILSLGMRKVGPEKGAALSYFSASIEASILAAEMSESPQSWIHPFDLAREYSEVSKTDLRKTLAQKRIVPLFSRMAEGLFQGLEWAIENNDIAFAEGLVKRLMTHEELRREVKPRLSALLSRRSAELTEQVQGWISDLSGSSARSARPIQMNPSLAPEIQVAAGLLMLLWDNKNQSDVIHEAFRQFSSLCEKHFYLVIEDQQNQLVNFDPRLHESADAVTGQVRVTRPRVSYVNPPHSRVVIKALVGKG